MSASQSAAVAAAAAAREQLYRTVFQEDDFDKYNSYNSNSRCCARQHLVHDILQALDDDETDFVDVYLVSSDCCDQDDDTNKRGIPANRFLLAARSPVLKRMLYGSFREAKSSTICMMGYDSRLIRAVVEYCSTDHIQHFLQSNFQKMINVTTTNINNHQTAGSHPTDENDNNDNHNDDNSHHDAEDNDLETGIRRLVELSRMADYLELTGLQRKVDRIIKSLMVQYPPLACAVWDEVPASDILYPAAAAASNNNNNTQNFSISTSISGLIQSMTTTRAMTIAEQQLPPSSSLVDDSFRILEGRPYVSLDSESSHDHTLWGAGSGVDSAVIKVGGGIECIRADRLVHLLRHSAIAAGELFLFRMLRRWFDQASQTQYDAALDVAFECSRYLRFECIEPQLLLREVQGCPFVPSDRIFDALARQALRASQHGVWSLNWVCPRRSGGSNGTNNNNSTSSSSSHGSGTVTASSGSYGNNTTTVDRILVEECGSRDANGLYYRIAGGLANQGGLYSKREVNCGQQLVYTISCSIKEDHYEARLFCSKLLTNQAVVSLANMLQTVIDPVFQPVFQILSVELPQQRNSKKGINGHRVGGPSSSGSSPKQAAAAAVRKYSTVRLSDGDFHMHGTVSSALLPLFESGEISEYSVIKILEFSLYQVYNNSNDGDGNDDDSIGLPGIHITKATVVTSNPGLRFGHPIRLTLDHIRHHRLFVECECDTNTSSGLQTLYSCRCPVDSATTTTAAGAATLRAPPVPRTGWSVDRNGLYPGPTCLWIPATVTTTTTTTAVTTKAAAPAPVTPSLTISASTSYESTTTANGNQVTATASIRTSQNPGNNPNDRSRITRIARPNSTFISI